MINSKKLGNYILTEELVWHKRFLSLAEHIATWSKDPSSQIGAVIVDPHKRIISMGYNGFPAGVCDDDRLHIREVKYKIVLHAEENAIIFAKRDLTGCVLYVSGLPPCSHCASLIIQSGIKEVYAWKQEIPERWKESVDLTLENFSQAGVQLQYIDRNL